ncbi:MAG: Smr/MutS family protein [Candidatus Helarchaeota archaeon]
MNARILEEAKEEILEALRKCENKGIRSICFIHGYHKHVLKDFITSQKFIEFTENERSRSIGATTKRYFMECRWKSCVGIGNN